MNTAEYKKFLKGARKAFSKFPSAHRNLILIKKSDRKVRTIGRTYTNTEAEQVDTVCIFITNKLSNLTSKERHLVEAQAIVIFPDLLDKDPKFETIDNDYEFYIANKGVTDITQARRFYLHKSDPDPENITIIFSLKGSENDLGN